MEPPDLTRIDHEHCGELLKDAKEVEQQDAKCEIREAIEYLEKAFDESIKARADIQLETNLCLAFGLLFIQHNQVKTAIKWFEKAFILAKEQEDNKQEIEASMKLASAYKLDNQLQMAMRYDKKVLEMAEGQKDRSQENIAKKKNKKLSKLIGKLNVCHLLKYVLYCSNCFCPLLLLDSLLKCLHNW
jgi:tetratricopeptide (TPR) repeat protein